MYKYICIAYTQKCVFTHYNQWGSFTYVDIQAIQGSLRVNILTCNLIHSCTNLKLSMTLHMTCMSVHLN